MQGETTTPAPVGASRIDTLDCVDELAACVRISDAIWMMAADIDNPQQDALREVCNILQTKIRSVSEELSGTALADWQVGDAA
ncbi:MAG: hypothetical protein DI589_13750 [Shinella sp.]|nr:MAG: hypothetical protein DI589_13750 [Shinella sp.]